MTVPFLRVIRNFGKKQPSRTMAGNHLMLAGMNQALFHKNWGDPETQIFLKKLGGFNIRGALYLIVNSDEEADYSIWIYRHRDRVLFFTKKKLIVHFKWSGYEDRGNQQRGKADANAMKMASALLGKTFALVA